MGVVDLKQGMAVHAVAGKRSEYRPVQLAKQSAGDASALLCHYRKLGIGSLYIADLDAICGGQTQVDLILRLLEHGGFDDVLVDIGFSGAGPCNKWMQVRGRAELVLIAATESMQNTDGLIELVDRVGPSQVALGLDYQAGVFRSVVGSEAEWLVTADRCGVRRMVVLDTAVVGTRSGPSTLEMCWRLSQGDPRLEIDSGGGVRDAEDAKALFAAGCARCLMATALLECSAN
ncbi:HisA/HisF-related TIM barrel protein [Planctomycetes bacterium CA13]|uniref:HisA/HisF-related TIM barrel protein n=1 Tax=Novipirellula herctigrandis TaxID=2527986 RepID=UPI0011B7B899